MEIWDAYDKSFNRIPDITLVRGKPIPAGLYHLVADVIVRHVDGQYLVMQRDLRKHFGGLWEATAGGSALKGETPLACAIRELGEETGIFVRTLTEIGRVVSDDYQTIYVEYLCVTDCDKDSIVLQEGETMDFMWVDKDRLLDMKESRLVTDRAMQYIEELRNLY